MGLEWGPLFSATTGLLERSSSPTGTSGGLRFLLLSGSDEAREHQRVPVVYYGLSAWALLIKTQACRSYEASLENA